LAEEALASARTDAARTLQDADQERDRIIAAANAGAAERVGEAHRQVATILLLAGRGAAEGRQGLLEQIWRDRVRAILRQAGSVVAVDPAGGSRLILPAPP
jgi:hypothetical protein